MQADGQPGFKVAGAVHIKQVPGPAGHEPPRAAASPDLVRRIQAFVDAYNASATPFVWVATVQSIIDKVSRLAMRISGTAH